MASAGVSFAYLAILAFSPVGDSLERALGGDGGRAPWIYVPVVLLIGALFRFPFRVWGWQHERAWRFSTQSFSAWLLDWAKASVLGIALMSLALLALNALASAFPSAWPWIADPGAALLVIVLSFLGPVVFEPLFNRFRPVEDALLVERLRDLAGRASVRIDQFLVADASRRTKKENAYVSGLGATRRLVVYDTLLARATPGEIELVVAHELGHWRARHTLKGTATAALGAAVAVIVLWLLLRSSAVLSAIHATGPADPGIAPFALLIWGVIGLVTDPIGLVISRSWERHADRGSIELTGNAAGFAEMERNLSIANLAELAPSRLAYLFSYSHPAPADRIAAAREAVTRPTTGS